MTEVAFHFNAPDKLAYACRLLRKAVGSGAKAIVLGSPHDMSQLDAQLWTFGALEFVPHALVNSPAEVLEHSPVILTSALSAQLPHHDVLVHLGQDMPQGFDAFKRVIEVVSRDDADRQQARQRWKRYTELGYQLIRHDLNLRDAMAG